MSTEAELRLKLVDEAKSWLGTPYVSNACVKGKRGGTDCAMLLLGIYRNVGLLPSDFNPTPYPAQWHLHQSAELYLNHVQNWAKEIVGPPEPGDIVLIQLGRLFAHGAIVTAWPNIIHAIGNDRVAGADLSKLTTGKHALWRANRKFYSWWGV